MTIATVKNAVVFRAPAKAGGGTPAPAPALQPLPPAPIYTRRNFGMAKVKFELNLPGLNAVMKSGGIQAQLQAAGNAVAGIADGNYGVRVHDDPRWLAIANVYPNDQETAIKNSEQNELLKALGAAGLPMTK